MAFDRNKLNKVAQPRPQEDVEAAKRRKAARKVTSNLKITNTTMNKKDNYEDYSDKEYRYPRKV